MKGQIFNLLAILSIALIVAQVTKGQTGYAPEASIPSRTHPAISYSTKPLRDPVTELSRKIEAGAVQLIPDPESGYLPSILKALDVPVESQVAVFSRTSLQSERIGPDNPRTIFFNDSVAVAWPRGGFIELASTDPEQGIIFYTLGRRRPLSTEQSFVRSEECLTCHVSSATLRVPGLAVGSVVPLSDWDLLPDAPTLISDHCSPFGERWGGWYVTGKNEAVPHLGNRTTTNVDNFESFAVQPTRSLESLQGKFDLSRYLTPYSDIVALMVLTHQAHMTNLLTRIGWSSRIAAYEQAEGASNHLSADVRELVDYMLFVDEALLPGRIDGTSGFAQQFAVKGPMDTRGRSLRQLDLERRLLRYPCSYMIYSQQFDSLPSQVKEAIYRRMWAILSGEGKDRRYSRLSITDRTAIVEILRDTKNELPSYFQATSVK